MKNPNDIPEGGADPEADTSFPMLPMPKRTPASPRPKVVVSSPMKRGIIDETKFQTGDSKQKPQSPEDKEPGNTPGQRLGDYELIRPLGQGGMGVVYLARHLTLGRLAALKSLTQGKLATPEQQERFEAEARIAANLQHPNIVQVFDLGNSNQGQFIAFEYIEGQTLAEKIAGQPQPPRFAAEHVRTLALAIEYAHQKGIIHRDLKPANILIDTYQVPKIADFGLARAMGVEKRSTLSGEIFGTPAYMSPEQASGATSLIGAPTDIYSLGAILYELLTGTTPFRGTDGMAIILAMLAHDPPPPRQLDRAIPRDLETICLKCLEKVPTRRYQSATALAEDLQRYLNGEPIHAKPASSIEKVWKWVRRHPSIAALIAFFVIGLSTFLSYALWKNNQLAQMLAHSDGNFRAALETTRRRIDTAGQPAEQVLEEELRFLKSIQERSNQEVTTRYETAIAAGIAGQVLHKLGRLEEAIESLDQAEVTLTALVREDSQWASWYQSELASLFGTRAQVEQSLGRLEQAEDSLHRGLDLFRQLSEADPENAELIRDQAAIWNNLGLLSRSRGNLDEATQNHGQSLKLKEGLHRNDPKNARYLSDLIISLNNLASIHLSKSEWKEAGLLLERALSISRDLPNTVRQTGSHRFSEAGLHMNLGHVSLNQSNPDQAIDQYREGANLFQSLLKDYPEVTSWKKATADAHVQLGGALMQSGLLPPNPDDPLTAEAKKILSEAIENFEGAVVIYDQLAEMMPEDPSLRETANRLRPGIEQLKAALQSPP